MSEPLPHPRVVFAYSSVGAGHRQAAKALQAGLNLAAPALATECVDVLDFVPKPFRLYYAGGYAIMVTRLPRTYGLGYWLSDRSRGPGRTLGERVRLAVERHFTRNFHTWLLERRPALVVQTHFLSPPGLGRMIEQGLPGVRQMVVVTDHEMHRFWCSEGVDRFFVPDEYSTRHLQEFGIPGERIELAGIPVHPKWHEPVDAARVYADWKLPSDRPIVLLSGGVEFTIGRIDRLADQICRRLGQAFVLVLAGGNKKLLAQIARMPSAQGPEARLRGVGFTDRIHELASVAGVIITKAGGLITTECVTKGVGMILMKPVPGQEARNAQRLVREGAAVLAPTAQDILDETVRLLTDPAALENLRCNARRLAMPSTDTIVARILEAVGTEEPR